MGMSSKKLFRWYKDVLCGYKSPAHQRHLQKTRASRSLGSSAKSPVSPDLKIPILNEKNMGSTICIDEKNINGDCYTIVSNPETNKIVLMVNTLRASQIVYLMRSNISQEALFAVSCVTRDMAPNYDWVARELFPNAYQVADKFHVVKNIIDQVQGVRIRYRQELLRKQRELDEASRKRPKLLPDPKIQQELKDLKKELTNGDTLLQLLQRSKGLLHKLPNEHSASQKLRAQLLFRLFPDIKEAYKFDLKVKMVGEMEFFFSIDADYTQVKGFGVPKRGFCESKGQNGWLKSPLLSCLCYLWVFEKTNMNHKNARSALALS